MRFSFLIVSAQIGLTDLLPVGNVYQGISWSFYYGYISLILPGLAEQIRAFGHEMADVHKCDKLLMALPESCRIPNEMKDVDKNFITVGNVEQIGVVAGKSRSYKVPLYQIKDEKNGKVCIFVLYILIIYYTINKTTNKNKNNHNTNNIDDDDSNDNININKLNYSLLSV